MTLKQFFQIAAGALISLIIYSTNLYPIIKIPLMIFFAAFGVALAFLPLEERPLERWIVAFFRSIYSPTVFFWKKADAPIKYFRDDAIAPIEKIIYTGGEAKLQEYLSTTPLDAATGNLNKGEQTFLSKLSSIMDLFPIKKTEVPQQKDVQGHSQSPFSSPLQVPTFHPNLGGQKIVVEETAPGMIKQTTPTTQVSPFTPRPFIATQKKVQFSVDAAPPSPPTTPNTIVGQVMDQDNKIIQGAILEVKDSTGRPVRALKSNMLGHFMVVTPLQSGRYEINTEKDGFNFETVAFEASGEIIPPIAIAGSAITQAQNPSVPPTQSVIKTTNNFNVLNKFTI